MQDEHVPAQNDETANANEKLIDYLGSVWQRQHEPTVETLQQMARFVTTLPEPYKTQGLQAIAEHLTNAMSLHMLELMTTFQQKAEQEGIDAEEVAATFEDVLQETFQVIAEVNEHVRVHSIDGLINLSNITVGLAGLSRVNSAERAQHWAYTLPRVYLRQVERENLVEREAMTDRQETTQLENFTTLDNSRREVILTSSNSRVRSTETGSQRNLAILRLKILSSVA